jgi:Terminase RNaseH-like domain
MTRGGARSSSKGTFLVGVDLGQMQDYTAVVVVEPQGRGAGRAYHVRHIERMPLGTSYVRVVERIRELVSKLRRSGYPIVAADATGVGAGIMDLMTDRDIGARVYEITLTGGDTVSQERSKYRVPKRDVVSSVAALLETDRLRIASALPLAEVLGRELGSFRVKIDAKSGHDSYGAWRERDHDDLVLATALACWIGERINPGEFRFVAVGSGPSDRWRGY